MNKKNFSATNVGNIIFDFENGMFREKCLAQVVQDRIDIPEKLPKNILKSRNIEEVETYFDELLKKYI